MQEEFKLVFINNRKKVNQVKAWDTKLGVYRDHSMTGQLHTSRRPVIFISRKEK